MNRMLIGQHLPDLQFIDSVLKAVTPGHLFIVGVKQVYFPFFMCQGFHNIQSRDPDHGRHR